MEFVYFEALERPRLDWQSLDFQPSVRRTAWDPRHEVYLPCTLAEETGHNRFCPLKVYRLDAHDAGRLQDFESQRRMAQRVFRNKKFSFGAVARNGLALIFADESLRSDRVGVLAAVTQDGCALQYADENLRSDRDVVLAAVKRNGMALQFADVFLRSRQGPVRHISLIAFRIRFLVPVVASCEES